MPSGTILLYVCLCACLNGGQNELVDVDGEMPKGTPPFPGSPWPMPKMWTRHDTVNSFNPWNYTVTSTIQGCDLIDHALRRFRKFLQSEDKDLKDHFEEPIETTSLPRGATADSRTTLTPHTDEDVFEADAVVELVKIRVHEGVCPRYPQQGMKEDYNLSISDEILLEATSAWGVIRGLTTLQQLLYTVRGNWYINDARIEDEPRFLYRGLHLDTARHFYPVGFVKRNLDVMSAHKLNVLHWHLSDDESFPYRSDAFPELAEKGAFSPRHTYSRHDVKQIIDYARLWGIRVIPEFNTPGHAHSWGQAIPDLLTPCEGGGKRGDGNTSHQHTRTDIFDPSKNSTFQFLREFFTEITNLFQDNYLHIGLDDTYWNSCWADNSNITTFMEAMQFGTDLSRLKSFYDERLLGIIDQLGKSSIVYEDVVSNRWTVPNRTIIHQWKHTSLDPSFKNWQTNMAELLKHDKHVVFTSCWTLDDSPGEGSWKALYACDPAPINATDDQLTRLLGGEARPQAQYMDQHNMLQTLWPRVAAVSERLWSPSHVTDIDDAQLRLDQHRCRLLRHGIPVSPVNAGFCQSDYNVDNARSHLVKKQTTQAPTTEETSTLENYTKDETNITVLNTTHSPLTNLSITTIAKTTAEANTGKAKESSGHNSCNKEYPRVLLSLGLVVLTYMTEKCR